MTPTHLILTGNASWSGVTGIILHFFLQYSSNLLQFVQCSGNIMFLQVLSRKIRVGDVMDVSVEAQRSVCLSDSCRVFTSRSICALQSWYCYFFRVVVILCVTISVAISVCDLKSSELRSSSKCRKHWFSAAFVKIATAVTESPLILQLVKLLQKTVGKLKPGTLVKQKESTFLFHSWMPNTNRKESLKTN